MNNLTLEFRFKLVTLKTWALSLAKINYRRECSIPSIHVIVKSFIKPISLIRFAN